MPGPYFFFLYIASMRLRDKEAAEDVHRREDEREESRAGRAQIGPLSNLLSSTLTASNAPTTITDEIALVTDISGVCSAGVTARRRKTDEHGGARRSRDGSNRTGSIVAPVAA